MKTSNWDLNFRYQKFLFWVSFFVPSFLLILIIVSSCQDEIDLEEHAQPISQYLKTLDYDPNGMLNVQNIDGELKKTEKGSATHPAFVNNDLIVCNEITYNLQQNAEQVAIIRPTNGIIWPGALVKINAGLLNGMPEPVTLKPSPTRLSVDLPGMGLNKPINVENPSNSNTQAEIDKALDWWLNNNKSDTGYINPANISYKATTSFKQEQLAMELGLNVKWASGSVSTLFNRTSTSTEKVAMMVFKQVFYTITFDTPSQPGIVFDPSVGLEQIKSTFSTSEPPGYVHSVSYGRIIMFRMKTTESAQSNQVEAAMMYGAGKVGPNVSADLKVKYESILRNSTIEVITIGGNADTASYATQAQSYGDLAHILTGSNAKFSKSNPGVPIAYTVKFLKDNKVAKMGYTTDYTAKECTVSKKGTIKVYVRWGAGYVAKFMVSWTNYNGTAGYHSSGDITVGNYKTKEIPGGSYGIKLNIQAVGGAGIIIKNFDTPRDACFEVWGQLFTTHQEEVTCNF